MRLDEACPIWGEAALVESGSFDGWLVSSDRTDGSFRIARSAIDMARSLPPIEKAKLTTWIVDQRRLGEPSPMVTTSVIDEVRDRRPLSYRQKVERFFQVLRHYGVGLGSPLRIYGMQNESTIAWTRRLSAWLEIYEGSQLSAMLSALGDEGLIKTDPSHIIRPTAKGLMRLDDLSQRGAESAQAFVAMWFNTETDDAYVDGFEVGIRKAGYEPFRIDRKEHANKIDDEIVAEIRRSRFLVADSTCELIRHDDATKAVARGGVYYEAGFAQGLGIPVIWTVRADCIDHVHFDTRQYAHIVWIDPKDLAIKLQNRIGAVIGPRQRTA